MHAQITSCICWFMPFINGLLMVKPVHSSHILEQGQKVFVSSQVQGLKATIEKSKEKLQTYHKLHELYIFEQLT